MKLTFKRLWCYNFSFEQHVFEVLKGDVVLGSVENWEGRREWKAFIGSDLSCKFLSKHYSRQAAVDAIIKAAANL